MTKTPEGGIIFPGDDSMQINEQFRVLDESFLPRIAEVFAAAFSGEPWHDDWSDREQLALYIKDIGFCFNSLDYGFFDGDKLIAVSLGSVRHWWEGTDYIIEELCVSPEYQGRGVGSRFMQLIEADVKSRSICGIFLQTNNDKPSYSFYKRNGFKDLDRHVSLYKPLS